MTEKQRAQRRRPKRTARSGPAANTREPRFVIRYPEQLPIVHARDEIRAALAEHRVIVVCGDTGSGKSTQLPKICLEAGRGTAGKIGHTQPRRIAARSLAARLAEELGTEVGDVVGLEVRFTDRTSPASLVKVMTDGILLNEIRRDRALAAYDTLIIDEAHERSLNIDFLLGYLRRIEARRPDLKVIITSATIDPERFAEHFRGAPIVRVAGRSFPVAIRYRPPDEGQDLADAVVAAAHDLAATAATGVGTGGLVSATAATPEAEVPRTAAQGRRLRDMLVFLPGERWIRDTERALARNGPRGFEVLPLYARLSTTRQQRIFKPGAAPRIVLATNIAETSLTVPRIGFVIDSGLARVSRYSPRHRVQGLGVEPIAQANAAQRAGRCGRLGPGVCVRLYSEEDYEARPPFTEPEILRTNLAGVILQLEALGLGHVEEFPFLDSPPAKAVNDAYRLLHLLGALDAEQRLTPDGAVMARLPVDPRIARLLLTAHRNGALREALVVGAALSVPDPRDFPPETLDAARQKHRELADPRSDFASWLNLWEAFRKQTREGDKPLRAWCKERFLSLPRLKEWQEVHAQLEDLVRVLRWRSTLKPPDLRALHQAVLAAFVDYIAEHDEGPYYRGIHGARASLFPGSALAGRRPRWIVAAERYATERVYLRTAAQINPRWVARVAPHLVRREYREPEWDEKRGLVTAREVLTLLGLTLESERRVDYGPIAPAAAREIFLRDGLAADRLGRERPFLAHNRRVRAALLDWEARRRSRDLFIGAPGVAAFYRERLPPEVRDRASLERWCRKPGNAERLLMRPTDVATRDPATLPGEDYPPTLELAAQRLPLAYRFEPGRVADGITVTLPEALLGSVRPEELDWLVPGWLGAKVLALLRALPKDQRRALVPLPDAVAAVLPALERRRGRQPLAAALAEALLAERGIALDPSALERATLPEHLRMRIEVVAQDGRVLAGGRDLGALQERTLGAASGPDRRERRKPRRQRPDARGGAAQGAVADGAAATTSSWEQSGLVRWDIPDLPDIVRVPQRPVDLELYPTLIDSGGRVDLRLLPPGPTAVARHRAGVRRLLVRAVPQQAALLREQVLSRRELLLAFHGIGSGEALVDDLLAAAAERAFVLDPPVRTNAELAARLAAGRAEVVPAGERLLELLEEVLALHRRVRGRLAAPHIPEPARADIAAQLDGLVHPGFLSATPPEWQARLPRYLRAIEIRLDKLAQRHPKDAELMATVHRAARPFERWKASLPPEWPWPAAVTRYRWLLEELRVSLFAQTLGTAAPVSERRLEEAWRQAEREPLR